MSVGPFTEAYTKAQADFLKTHPEAANQPVAPLVQLMLDQEAATAKDFTEGKISQAEYDGFLAKSESGLSDFRDHLHEAGKDIVQNFEDWAHDAKEEFDTLKQDHPEVVQALETGHVTAADGAVTFEFAVNVVEPLVDTVFDSVDVIIDHIDTGLSDAAATLVDARNSLPCVDAEERSANLALLDAAQGDWHQVLDGGKDALASAHDKISEDFGQAHDVVDAFRDYAADHPDAVLIDQTIDAPDVQQQIQHESDLAEA
jgi:ElaB/YqjD/DUF883 family membrane-anchored ribosome-binding protein